MKGIATTPKRCRKHNKKYKHTLYRHHKGKQFPETGIYVCPYCRDEKEMEKQ